MLSTSTKYVSPTDTFDPPLEHYELNSLTSSSV